MKDVDILKKFINFMRRSEVGKAAGFYNEPGDYKYYEDKNIKAMIEETSSPNQMIKIWTKDSKGLNNVFIGRKKAGIIVFVPGEWMDYIAKLVYMHENNIDELQATKDILKEKLSRKS